MERKFKKVTGERIVAALIDAFVSTVLVSIPTAYFMFKDGFEAFITNYSESIYDTTSTGDYGTTFIVASIVGSLIIGVLYFAVVPAKWNGQTLGKKIMSIKVIDEFGNNPGLGKHIIRAIQVWDAYVGLIVLPVIFVNAITYSLVSGLIGTLVSLVVFVSFIMMLSKDNGQGIHDSMAGTFVVKTNIDMEKEFIEKATALGDWAEVDYNLDKDSKDDSKDDWYQ